MHGIKLSEKETSRRKRKTPEIPRALAANEIKVFDSDRDGC